MAEDKPGPQGAHSHWTREPCGWPAWESRRRCLKEPGPPTKLSSDAEAGRPAIGAGMERAQPSGGPADSRRMGLGKECGEAEWSCGKSRNRRRGQNLSAGIAGAVSWSSEDRRGTGRRPDHCRCPGNRQGAVVGSMAAATGRKARLCGGREERRGRSQPELQDQNYAECAPHGEFTPNQKQSAPDNR
jgi:hypothetical protein